MHDDLVQLHQKRLKQVSNNEVRPREFQERDLVFKKTLSFQPDSRGKWTPNYEGACPMTLVTTNVDKPACWCSQEILCQNIQKSIKSKNQKKSKSSIGRKPEKAT